MNSPHNSITHSELESIVSEAAPRLAGRRLLELRDRCIDLPTGIEAAADPVFLLLLEADGRSEPRVLRLLLGLTAGLNFLAVTPERQKRSKKGTGSIVARRLNAALSGARVGEVELDPDDRIVTFSFEAPGGERFRLVAELFGRHPNLLLVDNRGTVHIAFRERSGPGRTIREGAPYDPPGSAAPPGSRGASAASDDRTTNRFATAAAEGAESTPERPAGLPVNAAAARHFTAIADAERLDTLRRSVRKRLSQLVKRTRARIADGERRLAEAAEAETFRHRGDLLKAHFHLIRRGMTSIELPDILSDGSETVTIPLDPKCDAAGNLEALYRKYRKAQRSVPHLKTRLAADRDLLDRLIEDRNALAGSGDTSGVTSGAASDAASGGDSDAVPDAPGLEEIAVIAGRLPATSGGGRRPSTGTGSKGKGRKAEGIPGLRRFRLAGGRTLLAGRDGETNHRLLRKTRGRDIWLHCHNVPGAHVVIPLEKGESAPLELLLAAGLLAVHFSRRRGAERADVIYTEAKHVRPVKGGKKGQVLVERFKTLHVRDDPGRLREILDAIVP